MIPTKFIYIVLAFVLAPFILGPILVFFIQKMSARPEFQKIELPLVPDFAANYFRNVFMQLSPAGFQQIAYLVQTGYTRGLTLYIMFLENAANQDSAIACASVIQPGKGPPRHSLWVEFFAQFSDESSIAVNNSVILPAFKMAPEKTILQFPQVADASLLNQVYIRVVQKYGKWGKASFIGRDPIDILQKSMIKEMSQQAQTGYLYLTSSMDTYRPTPMGAVLMTWKLAWPVGAIRRMIRKSQSEKLLRELQIGSPPPIPKN